MNGTDVTVTDAPDASRYEARLGDEVAGYAQYRRSDGRIAFTHTVVDPAHEGRGIGGSLARAALDDARRRHLAVEPRCPFIRAWIEKHPDYADLVR